jgi:hypothetical protein
LVYKALAAPSNVKYTTIGDNATPNTRSWTITTLPPGIVGYRPTAHFIIDSRTTDSAVLTQLENILYGDADSDATIPTVSALMGIFGGVEFDAGDADMTGADFLDGGGA